MKNKEERIGMVALIGKTNVGKSTLLNQLIDQKVSITSRKPQTTRHRLLGIKTKERNQIIYVDTPGFHQGHQSCLLYTSPSPRDMRRSRMPSSA